MARRRRRRWTEVKTAPDAETPAGRPGRKAEIGRVVVGFIVLPVVAAGAVLALSSLVFMERPSLESFWAFARIAAIQTAVFVVPLFVLVRVLFHWRGPWAMTAFFAFVASFPWLFVVLIDFVLVSGSVGPFLVGDIFNAALITIPIILAGAVTGAVFWLIALRPRPTAPVETKRRA